MLQMRGNYQDAASRLAGALILRPSWPAANFAIARCYHNLGNTYSALAHVRTAISFAPENDDAHLLAAELYTASGNMREAVEHYENVIQRHPDNISARYNAARLLQRYDADAAIAHYEYIRRNITSDYNTLLSLADLYTGRRQHDRAIEILRELLVINPADRDLYSVLSTAYILAGRHAEAIALLDEVHDHLNSDSAYADFLLTRANPVVRARVMLVDPALRDYAEALAARIVAYTPARPSAWLAAGMLRYNAGNDDGADSLMTAAVLHPQSSAALWLEASRDYLNVGQAARALRFMVPSAGRFGENAQVHHQLGEAYLATGQFDSAEHAFQRSVAIDNGNYRAWAYLGTINTRLAKPAAAENAFRRALDRAPDDAGIMNNFAYSLAQFNRKLDVALALVNRALADEPNNESFLDTKGWILFGMGEYKQALEYIRRSIAIGGASAEVYEHLGDAYRAVGDNANARNAYERAIHLDPLNEALRGKRDATP